MIQKEKLITRLLQNPKNFSWRELTKVLATLGFKQMARGKTSGSREKFYNETMNLIINLHKPHPSNTVKAYAIKQVIEKLKEVNLL